MDTEDTNRMQIIESETEDVPNQDDRIRELAASHKMHGGYVELWRKPAPGDGGEPEFIERYDPETFNLAEVKSDHGGGRYEAVFKNARKQFVDRILFRIDRRAKPAHQNGSDNGANSELLAMVDRMAPKTTQGKIDWTAILTILSPALVKLVEKLFDKPQTDAALMTLVVENMKAQRNSTKDALTLIEQVKGIIPQGEGGGDADVWKQLAGALPSAIEAFQKGAAPTGAGHPQISVPPVNGGPEPETVNHPSPQPSPVPSAPTQSKPETNQQMSAILNLVLRGARQDGDPATYANLIEDQLTDDQLNLLQAALLQENWFDQIFGAVPGAAQYRDWLGAVREQLLTVDESDGETTTADQATTESNE